jgi:RHS repeat-associated protein
LSESSSGGPLSGLSITNGYDNLLRRTVLAMPSQPSVFTQFGYDNASRLQTIADANSDSVTNTYLVNSPLVGQIVFVQSGNVRMTTTRQYDYLNRRTNNALVLNFGVNPLNELTNVSRTANSTLTVAGATSLPATSVTVNGSSAQVYSDNTFAQEGNPLVDGTNTFIAVATYAQTNQASANVSVYLPASVNYSYDGRGNLTNDGLRSFVYDDENQLTSVTVANAWRSEFDYDGLLRRRIRREYTWSGTWYETNEVHYVYDGRLVIQERDVNNVPQVTYTRGNDLGGGLEKAGGIGGLLARTDNQQMTHAFYHCDGNGNVTCLIDSSGEVVARYAYDPFGNMIAISGTLANANLYRFSSKEYHPNSGLVYYLYRYYDPNLQRWINRDLLEEYGGLNLFQFALNNPLSCVDRNGLDIWAEGPSGHEPTGHKSINVGDPNGNYCSQSFGKKPGWTLYGEVYPDDEKGGPIERYMKTTPEQDKQALKELTDDLAYDKGKTLYGPTTCRTYNCGKYNHFKQEFHTPESTPPERKPAPRDKSRRVQDNISSSGKPCSSSDSSSNTTAKSSPSK